MAVLQSIPETLDWTWYVGDTEPEKFTVTGEQPIDLTDHVIAAQARVSAKDQVVAATAIITNPVGYDITIGEFAVSWDEAELRALVDAATGDRWIGVWDLQITKPDGSVRTRVRGIFTAILDVTRA